MEYALSPNIDPVVPRSWEKGPSDEVVDPNISEEFIIIKPTSKMQYIKDHSLAIIIGLIILVLAVVIIVFVSTEKISKNNRFKPYGMERTYFQYVI